MIPPGMQTVGDVLKECGGRLAPFERLRVGRSGCVVSLVAMAGALAVLAAGAWETGGSWASGFRFVVLSGMGAAVTLFLGYAIVETIVERSVRNRIKSFMASSGTDLETLSKAAELRRSQLPGGNRLLALLKERQT